MIAACVLLAFAALVILAAVLVNPRSSRRLEQAYDDRANDATAFAENMRDIVHEFSEALVLVGRHNGDDLRTIIDALVDDRQRLVTAVLAAGPNPQAARTLGLVDQAQAGRERAETIAQYLEENRRVTAADTEFQTSDGDAIIPVGMDH